MSAWPRRAISSRMAGVRPGGHGHPTTATRARAPDAVAGDVGRARRRGRPSAGGDRRRAAQSAGSAGRGCSGCSRPCRPSRGSRTRATSRATCRSAAGRRIPTRTRSTPRATDSRIRFRSSSGTSRSGLVVEPEEVDRDERDVGVDGRRVPARSARRCGRPSSPRGRGQSCRPAPGSCVGICRRRGVRSPAGASHGRLVGQVAVEDQPIGAAGAASELAGHVVETPRSGRRRCPGT